MKKLLSGAFVLLFAAAVLMPVIAVNAGTSSFNYSFTMKHRYVDGWDNWQVYTLPAGTATISGDVYAYPIDAGDKYYLTVWTVEEDHWYHSGHGKVTVKY